MNVRFAGFIDDIEKFDAELFKISHAEASGIDPQTRLLMEADHQLLIQMEWNARSRNKIGV